MGFSVRKDTSSEYWRLQQRLLSHADKCWNPAHLGDPDSWIGTKVMYQGRLSAVHNLAILYESQSKQEKAEQMYIRVMQGYEKTWGREFTPIFDTITNLGRIYCIQGKMEKAEQMYVRALQGYEKTLGREHVSTLDAVNHLRGLYYKKGKLEMAGQIYVRALQRYERALRPDHMSTLSVIRNLGVLYDH